MRIALHTSLVFFLCFPVFAQTSSTKVPVNLLSGLKWRSIGPFRGGRSIAVSAPVGGSTTFYFGAVGGGVWKTEDAGTVWNPIFDDQPAASIGALAVAPSDPNVLYAGTGESDIRSDLASGDGVYRSLDAGKTWTNCGLKQTRQISRIAIDPRNPATVFVAALGHAYAPNEDRGVFRSMDSGETWEKVLYQGPEIGAADLAIATDHPSTLFAAMWEAHRPPWSTYAPLAGPGSALYRSTDGGSTWTKVAGRGFPVEIGRIGIALASRTQGKRVYATVESKDPKIAGLYRSDDGGDSWTLVNSDPRLTGRAWYFSSITVDPNDPDVVYIPNVALYKLSAGGRTLSIVRGAPGGDDYHQLWIDPANSQRMALASDQGATISLNGGVTWTTWYNQPTGQFYHVITDNAYPYHVYGAQQDSSTAAIASSSDYGQIDNRNWFSIGGSESGYIAPDPKDPNIFYTSGSFGTVERFDKRTAQSQNIAPWPIPGGLSPVSERKFRDPWTPVLVFSPVQHNALYLGTQYVMKTLDGGLHWQAISPDLTGKSAAPQSASTVTVENAKELGYGIVYSISPSPLNAAEIWAGTDTGLIHLTRNGGSTWSNVTPPGLAPWSKVTHLETSHFIPGEAFAAVDRHRLDDMQPYLYRTRDYGKTWKLITDGIGSRSFLNAVREDPLRKGLLYIATEDGVYISFDDGDRWQSLQLNLPTVSVRDLVIHDGDLVAGTHGRGFWILDNVSPLRQVNARTPNTGIILFKPARAIRTISDRFPGTPLPPEEPQARNPPRGAYLDYYLPEPVSGELLLEIQDAHGKVIRRFSSKDKVPDMPVNLPIAPRWFDKPQQLSTAAGMHRWIWDLRYGRGAQGPEGDSDDEDALQAPGPFAVPGTYQVTLTAATHQFRQPLQIALDPRSAATPADLQAQFQWAQRIYSDMLLSAKALAQIKTLRPHLSVTQQQSLTELLAGSKQNPGLAIVDRNLNALLSATQTADRTPPSQVIDAYQDAARQLRLRLAQWSNVQQQK